MGKEDNKVVRELSDVLRDENIIDTAEFHDNVDFVFSKIANSVGKTLGPAGSYIMISNIDSQSPVYPTKDGYTVVQEYKFNDQVKYFIAEIIKDITRRMNVNVGDSTTSGVVIAYQLYKYLMSYDITQKYPEMGSILPTISIRIILETIRKVITSKLIADPNYILKDLDRDIENEYIRKVAMVSANNDPEIGNMVSDLFIKRESSHVFVTAEVSTSDETYVDKEVGFQFGSGFINPIMANQNDRITCKLTAPKFFLVDGSLTLSDMKTLDMVIDYVIMDLKRPIVLIAKDYDQPVLNMLIRRCTRSVVMRGSTPTNHEKEPIVALTINTEYEKSKDRFEDLRILLGCEVVETKKGEIINFKNNADFIDKFLGEAAEFNGTQLSTRIKRGAGDKSVVLERIAHIEKRIKEVELNEGILSFSSADSLRRRIAMMNSDMSIIKVGGPNDKERRAKKLIFDDSILACMSAVSSGVSIGGNVNIPHCIGKFNDELVKEITEDIVTGSRHIVYGNKYEDVSKIVKDILGFVSESFTTAYKVAIENTVGKNTTIYEKILNLVYNEDSLKCEKPCMFNLVTNELVDLESKNSIPVPANTDTELMTSIFGTVGTFISSSQFLAVYPGSTTVYNPSGKK